MQFSVKSGFFALYFFLCISLYLWFVFVFWFLVVFSFISGCNFPLKAVSDNLLKRPPVIHCFNSAQNWTNGKFFINKAGYIHPLNIFVSGIKEKPCNILDWVKSEPWKWTKTDHFIPFPLKRENSLFSNLFYIFPSYLVSIPGDFICAWIIVSFLAPASLSGPWFRGGLGKFLSGNFHSWGSHSHPSPRLWSGRCRIAYVAFIISFSTMFHKTVYFSGLHRRSNDMLYPSWFSCSAFSTMAKGSIIRLWIVKGKKIESAIESEIKLRDLSSPQKPSKSRKEKVDKHISHQPPLMDWATYYLQSERRNRFLETSFSEAKKNLS